jgi:hypothetical protein
MLISLHLPKTAGSSFLDSLEEQYNNSVLHDYSDLPINTTAFRRKQHALRMLVLNGLFPPKGIECIHGHFLPLKYLFCSNVKFITWMRDPIERLGSHYYYWQRSFNPSNAPALHKQVIEEQWTLDRFCLSPQLRNIYSQFLWGFPINRFDFIGITEYFEADMEYFYNEILGATFQNHRKNTNEGKENSSYFEDNNLREKIEKFHSKDVSLYKHALNMRLTRRSTRIKFGDD